MSHVIPRGGYVSSPHPCVATMSREWWSWNHKSPFVSNLLHCTVIIVFTVYTFINYIFIQYCTVLATEFYYLMFQCYNMLSYDHSFELTFDYKMKIISLMDEVCVWWQVEEKEIVVNGKPSSSVWGTKWLWNHWFKIKCDWTLLIYMA